MARPWDLPDFHGLLSMGVGGSYGITASNRMARRSEIEMKKRTSKQLESQADAILRGADVRQQKKAASKKRKAKRRFAPTPNDPHDCNMGKGHWLEADFRPADAGAEMDQEWREITRH